MLLTGAESFSTIRALVFSLSAGFSNRSTTMRCISHRLAIPLFALLALQTASAASAADSAEQPPTRNAQYRHRGRARVYRHARESVGMVRQATIPQSPAKSVDPAAAKTDPPRVAVLIEAAIVELALKPENSNSGVDLARLGRTATQPGATVERARQACGPDSTRRLPARVAGRPTQSVESSVASSPWPSSKARSPT